MIFTFPISDELQGDFLTHFPLRLKKLLNDNIDLYTSFSGPINCEKLLSNDIKLLRMPKIKNKYIETYIFPFLLFFYSLFFTIKYKLDIFINANNHKWMFPVALATRICGSKTIATVGGDILRNTPKKWKSKIRYFYIKMIEKTSLHSVNRIHCVSQYLKEVVIKRSRVKEKNIIVTSRGVDITKFQIVKSNYQSYPLRIIFVGRLAPIKGLKYALNAVEKLLFEGHDLIFDIYGTGPQESFFKKTYYHLKEFNFYGQISHDMMPYELTKKTGILVIPSLDEGFPNILLEAMASGLFVIATRVADNTKILGNGERGILVDPGSFQQIKDALLFVMSNKSFAEKTIQNARNYIIDYHSFSSVRDSFLKLICF